MLRGEYLEFLKQLRIAKGQGEAVALSDLLGRSSSYVSKVETGSTAPSADYVDGLVKALGLSDAEGRQLQLLQRLYDTFDAAARPNPRVLVDWFEQYVRTVKDVRACGVTAVPRYLRWPGRRYDDEAGGAFPVRLALSQVPPAREGRTVRTVVFADALRQYVKEQVAKAAVDHTAVVDRLGEVAATQFDGDLMIVPSLSGARAVPMANFYLFDSWLAVIDVDGGPIVTCRPGPVDEMDKVFGRLWSGSGHVGRGSTKKVQARLRELVGAAEPSGTGVPGAGSRHA